MTPIFQKLLGAGVQLEALIRRTAHGIGGLFVSKAETARRASGRFEALQRRELEAERLDRLRNPRNYEGK
ncbi:MAG: hypothetical protein QOF48_2128 [Verrucomicrobiota bacterium]